VRTGTGRWLEIERTGFRWRLDPASCIGAEIERTGAWELATTQALLRIVRPGMHVVDVGANLGWFTLLFARAVGPQGVVWAFEPVAGFREQLTWHLRQNGLQDRVRVVPCALGDVSTERAIAVGESSATLHWTGTQAPPETEVVSVRPLDLLVPRLGIERVDLVKVDVDGHEPAFLRGAAATLARFRPPLCVEFAQHCLDVCGADVRDEARLLESQGYVLCDERDLLPFPTRAHFLRDCGNFDHSANVIALPVERLAGARVRIVDNVDELCALFGLRQRGVLQERDLDVVENDCELFDRKRRDAEVLCAIAASWPGDCLDLGTSHGRSAFNLAVNIGDRGRVFSVNVLPEAAQGAGELVTHLLDRAEIGAFYRARGARNVVQVFANTLTWTPGPEVDRLAVAFVDACHDAAAVKSDSHLAWQRLAPGGFLLWHDWSPLFRGRYPWIDAVMSGVESFLRDIDADGEVVHVRNSWIGVLRKPASPP
jgi:FkbM family methyltransferase